MPKSHIRTVRGYGISVQSPTMAQLPAQDFQITAEFLEAVLKDLTQDRNAQVLPFLSNFEDLRADIDWDSAKSTFAVELIDKLPFAVLHDVIAGLGKASGTADNEQVLVLCERLKVLEAQSHHAPVPEPVPGPQHIRTTPPAPVITPVPAKTVSRMRDPRARSR
jgi:hypothetical protein